jgi:iduronate 2-sulfatase
MTMMLKLTPSFTKTATYLATLCSFFVLLAAYASASEERPNILMIIVDDLKPAMGAYGDDYAITPQMDRLAENGTVFLNNHCQQAVCGASRASALTGLRPDTVRVWDFKSRMRDHLPDLVTLPQFLKQNGYHTASLGKVFDPRCCDGRDTNDVISWSQPHWTADTPHLRKNHFGAAGEFKETTECLPQNVPDNFYGDGLRTDQAVRILQERKAADEPFFLAVGYKKPHLPFVAPKKYWDLYDRNEVPLAELQEMPKESPFFHFQDSWELRSGYDNIPEGILPEDMQRRMIHGYYACVSYIDAQVGQLLDMLEALDLGDNTIVVLWGDHGWHLGDHGMWCKHTNYEQATRSPLIILDPRKRKQERIVSRATEFVDIFPSLVDMIGLEQPESLEGASLVTLIEDKDADFKPFAMSQFARSFHAPNNLMGYAFRNERYRLIAWIELDFKGGERAGELLRTELYDYQEDPLESVNLAASEDHSDLHEALLAQAREFASKELGLSWTSTQHP